jgi:hypothetical protein
MGAWDDGILDNDTAMEGLDSLQCAITEDIKQLGGQASPAGSAARLAAAIGTPRQLGAYANVTSCTT